MINRIWDEIICSVSQSGCVRYPRGLVDLFRGVPWAHCWRWRDCAVKSRSLCMWGSCSCSCVCSMADHSRLYASAVESGRLVLPRGSCTCMICLASCMRIIWRTHNFRHQVNLRYHRKWAHLHDSGFWGRSHTEECPLYHFAGMRLVRLALSFWSSKLCRSWVCTGGIRRWTNAAQNCTWRRSKRGYWSPTWWWRTSVRSFACLPSLLPLPFDAARCSPGGPVNDLYIGVDARGWLTWRVLTRNKGCWKLKMKWHCVKRRANKASGECCYGWFARG